ncbi:MAG TPA: hypothetical protein VLE73_05975 [Candidatus Saccharimonadales bacterium]|nr:hypothetical protein [Candidatus Saccharimonadales bacterium]
MTAESVETDGQVDPMLCLRRNIGWHPVGSYACAGVVGDDLGRIRPCPMEAIVGPRGALDSGSLCLDGLEPAIIEQRAA